MTTAAQNPILDGPAIPEMREAILTPEEVRLLVADLFAHARAIRTLCKAGPRCQAPPDAQSLEAAAEKLLSRSVAAIQIHYQFEDSEWTDTLATIPSGGVRLVRCRHAAAAPHAT